MMQEKSRVITMTLIFFTGRQLGRRGCRCFEYTGIQLGLGR